MMRCVDIYFDVVFDEYLFSLIYSDTWTEIKIKVFFTRTIGTTLILNNGENQQLYRRNRPAVAFHWEIMGDF